MSVMTGYDVDRPHPSPSPREREQEGLVMMFVFIKMVVKTGISNVDDGTQIFMRAMITYVLLVSRTNSGLYIPFLQFLHGIIAGAGGERHIGNTRVKTGTGCHARTICNKQIGHFVHLIESIEH